MGNQLRLPDNVTCVSTSTRNFNNRMGNGAKVYLASAEVAAVTSVLQHIPTPEEYFEIYSETVNPERVYRYMQFDDEFFEDETG